MAKLSTVPHILYIGKFSGEKTYQYDYYGNTIVQDIHFKNMAVFIMERNFTLAKSVAIYLRENLN